VDLDRINNLKEYRIMIDEGDLERIRGFGKNKGVWKE